MRGSSFVFFILTSINVLSQNLVYNHSFESYIICPSGTGNFGSYNLEYWTNPALSTPDYFNECCMPPCDAYNPSNLFGYQDEYMGNAYAGIGIVDSILFNYRENIQGELQTELITGRIYCIEFFINMANTSSYALRNLGVYFSDQIVQNNSMNLDSLNLCYLDPQVIIDLNYLADTVSWVQVSGQYTATGGERYFCIGNFQYDDELDWTFIDSNWVDSIYGYQFFSYYYIDEVNIYECDTAWLPEGEIVLPNLLTPNGDGKNDVYLITGIPQGTSVWIYNRWGNEVYYSENYQNDWAGTWNGNRLPSGTYFIQVVMPMGTRKTTYIELMY